MLTTYQNKHVIIISIFHRDENNANSLAKHMKSKFVKYLLGLAKNSQHGTRNTYRFVPVQDFTGKSDINWSDSVQEVDIQLYKKYWLSTKEIEHIETSIKAM